MLVFISFRVTSLILQHPFLRFRANPAPLNLCLFPGFDGASGARRFDATNDARLCPPDRTALSEFFNAAKGREWTESENWVTQYGGHCTWYGVTCDDTNRISRILLASNGLSGTLTKGIKKLTHLNHLDLSDNEIKVRGLEQYLQCAIGSTLMIPALSALRYWK